MCGLKNDGFITWLFLARLAHFSVHVFYSRSLKNGAQKADCPGAPSFWNERTSSGCLVTGFSRWSSRSRLFDRSLAVSTRRVVNANADACARTCACACASETETRGKSLMADYQPSRKGYPSPTRRNRCLLYSLIKSCRLYATCMWMYNVPCTSDRGTLFSSFSLSDSR